MPKYSFFEGIFLNFFNCDNGNAARADIESAPTVNRKFCNNARLHGASGTPPPTNRQKSCNKGKAPWRGQDPSLRGQWVKGCRGEQCSPGEFGGGARPSGTAKPPLCKGRWHGVSRDGGIGACAGALGCTRKATIPQSALSRSQPPLHKGAINSTPIN